MWSFSFLEGFVWSGIVNFVFFTRGWDDERRVGVLFGDVFSFFCFIEIDLIEIVWHFKNLQCFIAFFNVAQSSFLNMDF